MNMWCTYVDDNLAETKVGEYSHSMLCRRTHIVKGIEHPDPEEGGS